MAVIGNLHLHAQALLSLFHFSLSSFFHCIARFSLQVSLNLQLQECYENNGYLYFCCLLKFWRFLGNNLLRVKLKIFFYLVFEWHDLLAPLHSYKVSTRCIGVCINI